MAFIAIDAKADVAGSKKGKLTPAQHAQLNAFCLSNKTGILNCLNKCTVAQTVLTPSENKVTIKFQSGYVVICGRLVECEDGTTYTLTTPTTGTQNGKIILRFNLSATGESEFVLTSTTSALVQNDLNVNTLGTYEFALYDYVASPTRVTLTRESLSYVQDIPDYVTGRLSAFTGAGKPLYQYDEEKGTIEERLTKLGFKSGSVTLESGVTATENTIKKLGNFVIGNITISNMRTPKTTVTLGTIPSGFRPYKTLSFFGGIEGRENDQTYTFSAMCTVTINTSGTIVLTVPTMSYIITNAKLNFGFDTTAGNYQ